jgi:hypothetical protein
MPKIRYVKNFPACFLFFQNLCYLVWLHNLPVAHPEANSCSLHIPIKSKRQTPEIDLPLFKNDITNNLRSQKPVIYSSTQKF